MNFVYNESYIYPGPQSSVIPVLNQNKPWSIVAGERVILYAMTSLNHYKRNHELKSISFPLPGVSYPFINYYDYQNIGISRSK